MPGKILSYSKPTPPQAKQLLRIFWCWTASLIPGVEHFFLKGSFNDHHGDPQAADAQRRSRPTANGAAAADHV
jgi:hypothetical protein